MEKARILHIEDSEIFHKTVDLILIAHGLHRVVARAQSLSEATKQLEIIKENRSDTESANVILMDAHLRGSDYLNHPKFIIGKMKEAGLNLPIVGLSMDGLAERGLVLGRDIWADLTKEALSKQPRLLQRALDELPEPGTDD